MTDAPPATEAGPEVGAGSDGRPGSGARRGEGAEHPPPTRAERWRSALRTAAGQDDDEHDENGEPRQTMLAEAIGGVRGMVDSGAPTIVFVAANAIGGLRAGVIGALAVGIVIVLLRIVRHEPQQQAWSGFVGVAIAVAIAARTHHASGFFLPSIAKNAVYTVLGLVSLALRKPLAGYVFAAFDRKYRRWQTDRGLFRAAMWATALWIVVFAVRFVVQGVLYLANRPGWLAVANIVMSWPLWALAVAASVALLRRGEPESGGDGPGGQSGAGAPSTGSDASVNGEAAEVSPSSPAS